MPRRDIALDALVGAAGATLELPGRALPRRGLPRRRPPLGHGRRAARRRPRPDDAGRAGRRCADRPWTVTVPAGTASGNYTVHRDAADRRDAPADLGFTVDRGSATCPAAAAPVLALRRGARLGAGLDSVGTWAAASDAAGTIASYQARWSVDGGLGSPTTLVRHGPHGRAAR